MKHNAKLCYFPVKIAAYSFLAIPYRGEPSGSELICTFVHENDSFKARARAFSVSTGESPGSFLHFVRFPSQCRGPPHCLNFKNSDEIGRKPECDGQAYPQSGKGQVWGFR